MQEPEKKMLLSVSRSTIKVSKILKAAVIFIQGPLDSSKKKKRAADEF